MVKKTNFLVVIIFLFFAGTLEADTVYTSNGDTFVGQITEFDGHTIKIDTPSAGSITIDAKLIKSFSTDQINHWEIKNSERKVMIATATEHGHVVIDGQLTSLHDLRLKRRALPDKLSGIVELSWDMKRDEDRKRELHLKSELHYHVNKWRHELKSEIKHGELRGTVNEDFYEINYSPDYLMSSHWLVTLDTSYRKEGVTSINRYSHAGIGPGYRFWGEAKDQLDLMVSADKIRIRSGSVDLELNAIAAGIDYRQFFLSDRLESYIDYRITYPDWNGIDYIVNSTLGLRYSFTHYLYFSVKYDINKTRYALGTLQDRETNLVLGAKF